VVRRLDTISPTAAAAVGTAGALLIDFVANYNVPKGENGGTWPGIITGLGCLAVAGLLFGVIVPRVRRAGRATLILAVLALISLAVYWSGITPVLAAGAMAATTDAAPTRTVLVARVVAAVAGLAAIVAVLVTSHLV
jgi:hypothetical protein